MERRSEGLIRPLSPTRTVALMRTVATPIWLRVGIVFVLEVAGRRTGANRRVTVYPVQLDGNLYVLAFGGITDWALNLRAAGRAVVWRQGRSEAFSAVEVDGDRRDRVIATYLARLPNRARKDFDRRPDAAQHPIFRLEPTAPS